MTEKWNKFAFCINKLWMDEGEEQEESAEGIEMIGTVWSVCHNREKTKLWRNLKIYWRLSSRFYRTLKPSWLAFLPTIDITLEHFQPNPRTIQVYPIHNSQSKPTPSSPERAAFWLIFQATKIIPSLSTAEPKHGETMRRKEILLIFLWFGKTEQRQQCRGGRNGGEREKLLNDFLMHESLMGF
jgi:hypothetical protein